MRDGVESTVSLPTIGTRPGTRAEHKMVDSGIEEQDEGDDNKDAGMSKVAIVISVEDEMGRHVDIEDGADYTKVKQTGKFVYRN